jgi:hypothetical protein
MLKKLKVHRIAAMIPRTRPTMPRTLPVDLPFIAMDPRIIATTAAMHKGVPPDESYYPENQ